MIINRIFKYDHQRNGYHDCQYVHRMSRLDIWGALKVLKIGGRLVKVLIHIIRMVKMMVKLSLGWPKVDTVKSVSDEVD